MEFFFYKAMLLVTMALAFSHLPLIRTYPIGVNYGMNGDNLPAPIDVINFYNKCEIDFVRLFEPIPAILEALRGRRNLLVMGTRNEHIQNLATSQEAANAWINANVAPYVNSNNPVNLQYITVGNEVVPGPEATYVAGAILNLRQAIVNAGITSDIKVTTVVSMDTLAVSYPPSAGAFKEAAAGPIQAIIQALAPQGKNIFLNVYPYFAYAANAQQISLDFALFRSQQPVFTDGNLQYYNLFDAMVDSFYAALEKVGGSSVRVDIGETGWPSAGNEPYTSPENARAYNLKFANHAMSGKGTPMRPNVRYGPFIFEMFNENLKPAGVEQNFGMFYPNMQPVYPLWPKCR